MTVSTDALLCYGIAFGEDTVFPWQTGDPDWEILDWWRDLLGFRHSFEMFDEEGAWIGGKEWPQERQDAYFNEVRTFDLEHPTLPVEVVMHCSYNHSMFILAVPGSLRRATRGDPTEIDLEKLFVMPDKVDPLVAFCNAHGIEVSQPRWWLASMWG